MELSMSYKDYIDIVKSQLMEVKRTQNEKFEKAASILVDTLLNHKKFYMIASGVHSNMICEEAFYRAGNLMLVHPIFHQPAIGPRKGIKGNVFEHAEDYADALLESKNVGEGDLIMVISNSGANEFPVEVCLSAKNRGAFVISLSSIEYSSAIKPRHESGKRIHEIADIALDNRAIPGDAALDIEGFPGKVAPTSTITGAAIVNSIMILAVNKFLDKGITPPVYMSSNYPGASEWNQKYLEKHKSQIDFL